MVTFGWPWAFLLLPLPLIWLWRKPADNTQSAIAVPPALAAALDAMQGDGKRAALLPLLLLSFAWIALVTSIAQPALITGKAVTPASGRALALAIDLSGSMERRDFVLDGVASDRLSAVKRVATAFIESRTGDRIGLVLFGDEAFSASPVSFDRAAVSHALAESAIGMAGRTTAIGEALGLAIVKLRDDPAAERAIILLSDGTNNSGTAEPEDAARLAKDYGIRVHTIGLGSALADNSGEPIDPSADLDEKALRDIAEISGGQFFRARTLGELKAAYAAIDTLEGAQAPAPPFVPEIDITGFAVMAFLLGLAGFGIVQWREARA